jgi:hypothetical protein
MLNRALLCLALLGTLGTVSASAQGSVTPAAGALVPAPDRAPAGPAIVRIMTLTWTDVRVPGRLLAPPASHRAARPADQRWFTLTWQPASAATGNLVATAPAESKCTVMRLVAVPCE